MPRLTKATNELKPTTRPQPRASSKPSRRFSPYSSNGLRRSPRGTLWITTASKPWISSLLPCANHRATTVQEMVNLYETEMHQRRMEAGQQQILNQQRIGNMLQIGNLFMQGQILNQAQQINANTASASGNLDWMARAMGKR